MPILALPAAPEAPHSQHRRATFVRWLRRTHGWFGLWGAVLGLVFGFSGIWLNHRAVLKLTPAQERSRAQLALPEPVPVTPEALGAWLQQTLKLGPPIGSRIEPARAVPWATAPNAGGAPVMQPAHWTFNFGGPGETVQADYWQGNRSVGVNTTRNGLVATLTNMHKGTGMPLAWILLVDTLAGSLIFLSVSGVLLWTQTHRRRTAGLAIFGVSLAVALAIVLSRL